HGDERLGVGAPRAAPTRAVDARRADRDRRRAARRVGAALRRARTVTWLSDEVLAHVSAVSDAPDLSGTKYRLVRELGRGGMAIVYATEDSALGREVALKVSTFAAADAHELAERLRAEAQVIAGLEHPGIVPVHDVG